MKTITAIYENGMFRPTEPVDLPENATVQVVVQSGIAKEEAHDQSGIWEILSRRYNSGQHDTAERHNEHQPRSRYLLTRLR